MYFMVYSVSELFGITRDTMMIGQGSNPCEDGIEILKSRRSIRHFQDANLSHSVLQEIFEICRFSPTSRNSQSYYYSVIRDRKILEFLASLREEPSASLNRTPLAVAVCSDPGKSGAYIQDVYIAAYHFMVACRCYGVGTCWIAAVDRADVKKVLKIPDRHYVVTVTPVGYPTRIPESPPRRAVKEMVRF
jgi:nitroreductase